MKTVRTAAQILTMFSDQTSVVTVTAASNRFGLTPSAVSRMLAALASSGIIQREPDRSYRPGPLSYRMGLLYHARTRLSDIMNDSARKVVARTGATSWVSVLSGTDCMLLSRFPGPQDQGFHVDAGNLLPANASAGGKALLARLQDDELTKFFNSAKLNSWTERSKINSEIVYSDLKEIRERRWSLCFGELFIDKISAGVAFSTSLEPASMALSISIPQTDIDQLVQGVQALLAVAEEVGTMIGDSYWLDQHVSPDPEAILAEIQSYIRTYQETAEG